MPKSRHLLLAGALLALAGTTAPLARAAEAPKGPELKTEDQKTLYALGVAISRNLASFGLTPAELEYVSAGLVDGVLGRAPKVDLQVYGPKLQTLQASRAQAVSAQERKSGQAFADKAAGEKGAQRTPSGLIITTLKEGTGATPKATDTVKV